jgi:hypothetical protein
MDMTGLSLRSGVIAAAAIALSACAGADAPQPVQVSDVVVETDLSAVSSPQAASYWGNLSGDLSSAIAAEFVDQTAPEGWIVMVDVDEIALANAFQSSLGADEARLSGTVNLIRPGSDDVFDSWAVSASANEAATFMTGDADVTVVQPSSAEFYAAVVRAFASGVGDTVRARAPS